MFDDRQRAFLLRLSGPSVLADEAVEQALNERFAGLRGPTPEGRELVVGA